MESFATKPASALNQKDGVISMSPPHHFLVVKGPVISEPAQEFLVEVARALEVGDIDFHMMNFSSYSLQDPDLSPSVPHYHREDEISILLLDGYGIGSR